MYVCMYLCMYACMYICTMYLCLTTFVRQNTFIPKTYVRVHEVKKDSLHVFKKDRCKARKENTPTC